MVKYIQAIVHTENPPILPHTITQTEHATMLNDRLRQAGLKTTRPRLLVLSLLQELGGHRSIDDLIRGLKARGTPLPRASVYNVIAVLVNR